MPVVDPSARSSAGSATRSRTGPGAGGAARAGEVPGLPRDCRARVPRQVPRGAPTVPHRPVAAARKPSTSSQPVPAPKRPGHAPVAGSAPRRRRRRPSPRALDALDAAGRASTPPRRAGTSVVPDPAPVQGPLLMAARPKGAAAGRGTGAHHDRAHDAGPGEEAPAPRPRAGAALGRPEPPRQARMPTRLPERATSTATGRRPVSTRPSSRTARRSTSSRASRTARRSTSTGPSRTARRSAAPGQAGPPGRAGTSRRTAPAPRRPRPRQAHRGEPPPAPARPDGHGPPYRRAPVATTGVHPVGHIRSGQVPCAR